MATRREWLQRLGLASLTIPLVTKSSNAAVSRKNTVMIVGYKGNVINYTEDDLCDMEYKSSGISILHCKNNGRVAITIAVIGIEYCKQIGELLDIWANKFSVDDRIIYINNVKYCICSLSSGQDVDKILSTSITAWKI